eukprot:4599809-Amphidinium_carterae.1
MTTWSMYSWTVPRVAGTRLREKVSASGTLQSSSWSAVAIQRRVIGRHKVPHSNHPNKEEQRYSLKLQRNQTAYQTRPLFCCRPFQADIQDPRRDTKVQDFPENGRRPERHTC